MITNQRKRYTREFKKEAVKLVTELGCTISEAAKNLGIHPNLLSRWKRELVEEEKAGDSKSRATPTERA